MLYLTAIYAVRQDKKNKPLTLCPFCWGTPGGYDVLAKPLDPAEVDYVISAACRQMGGGPITPDAMPVSQCWALEADPHEPGA